jgi:hypothetical protein
LIKQLLCKWFGLDGSCQTCAVLRAQLEKSDRERSELLSRLLDKDKETPEGGKPEELVPIKPQFIPWRVRQQMLEAEDRKKAQLMKDKQNEMNDARISELEKELGVGSDTEMDTRGTH